MQGQLSEIDIRSILQLIELGQRTGELFVEAYPASSLPPSNGVSPIDLRSTRSLSGQSWFAFFLNGQIVYAGETDVSLLRLRDYLRRYQAEAAVDTISSASIAAFNAPEYGYLWALMENHSLTPAQGRSVIKSMIHETLFDLLSLHQGSFIFEIGSPLAPQLMTLETAPLVTKTIKQVQEWKQFHPHLYSPDQCPVIANGALLKKSLPEATFITLDRYADGKTSLRQIARYLHRDIVTVARALYPYVKRGWLHLAHPDFDDRSGSKVRPHLDFWQETKTPRVVWNDQGATNSKTVGYNLNQQGYEVSAIDNPLKALSLVFQLKPDLILCDIAMPELDGYEICAMLRKSTAFRQTPIVMLTGKDGFIDRVKARMVGATDYLTKPFGESELLMLLEKYVGLGHPNQPKADQLLSDALEEGLESNLT
ncbi:MAG: response regulator [Phormidesmis sp. CAN_BIN36]|nr:response regulator [Phormidesmis sp. CAN_BIN36]